MSRVHSPSAHTHRAAGPAVVANWTTVGPRALDALTDFCVWVEGFSGKLTERQSDDLFDAYAAARSVIYAADPERDQARMAALRLNPTTPAEADAVGMTTAKPEECTQSQPTPEGREERS